MRLVLLFALLGLAACMTQEDKDKMTEQAEAPLTCEAGADCAAKWHKSYRWVEDNAHYEIAKATDSEISTRAADRSTYAAVMVRKTPQPDGTYNILFTASCDNMLGCFPNPLQLKASFVNFVGADDDAPVNDNDIELGLTFAPINPGHMNNDLVITAVEPKSPAARAGLHAGDRLVKFNGTKLSSVDQLNDLTGLTQAGTVVTIEVEQDGRTRVMYMRV